MRFSSIVTGASALAASALAAPAEDLTLRNLVPFTEHPAHMWTLEEAKAYFSNKSTPMDNDSEMSSESTMSTESTMAATALPVTRCNNPAIRIEWRKMTTAAKQDFINHHKTLWNMAKKGLSGATQATTRYEELVWVHQQMSGSVHQSGIFLPWHRLYLYTWATMLRTETGYTGHIPWWDETLDAGNFGPKDGAYDIFTEDYYGPMPVISSSGQGTCIKKGAFGNRQLHIGGTQCLSRGENKQNTAQCNSDFVNYCNSMTNYPDMESCSEKGPHAYGHDGIGPVMANVALSPGDPAFFLHHTFVDNMYTKWQGTNEARLTTISGCASPLVNGACQNPLTKNTVLDLKGIASSRTVGEVLDTQNGNLMCYKYDNQVMG